MNFSEKKEIFLIFFFALLYVAPMIWWSRNLSFRLDSDYDMGSAFLSYEVKYVQSFGKMSAIFPYAATGLPIMGDAVNPIFIAPLIAFGIQNGLKIIFILTTITGGLSAWFLLRSLKIKGWLRLWGALLYMFSGGLSARFSAGHEIFFYSFIAAPLLLAIFLQKKLRFTDCVLGAALLALYFLSADVYGLWFSLILIGITRAHFFITDPNGRWGTVIKTISVGGIFIAFSSFYLLYVIRDIIPNVTRFYAAIPAEGSIHFFLAPLSYLIPWKVGFYDRPFFQRLLGLRFNWYEYYAFISPLPFFFLVRLKKVWKNESARLLICIIANGFLYVALRYPYSPYYWLFHFVGVLSSFRVPQRILMYQTAAVVAVCVLCAKSWFARANRKQRWLGIIMLASSLCWAGGANINAQLYAFEKSRTAEHQLAVTLRKMDSGSYFVGNFICCMQLMLTQQQIPIINFYSVVRLKSTPSFLDRSGEQIDYGKLSSIRPEYIIAKPGLSFDEYSYYPFIQSSIGEVWKTDSPNISPKTK